MIKFTLSESDFKQYHNSDNYELTAWFNKNQIKFIINVLNNHPDNQEFYCIECEKDVSGRLKHDGEPICSKCLKEIEA